MARALRRDIYVQSPSEVQACRDADDDIFLACALATEADAIVTEDKDLLILDGYCGLRIMTPVKFIALLDAGPQP